MKLLYSRHFSVSSALIRAGQWWGPWSHCAIVDGSAVIESRALAGGVMFSELSYVIARASEYQIVDVWTPNDEAGLQWARGQVGKPYDWTGVFAIPFKERDWQEEDAWYCSELVEAALVKAGADRWRPGLPGITPCQSYYNKA